MKQTVILILLFLCSLSAWGQSSLDEKIEALERQQRRIERRTDAIERESRSADVELRCENALLGEEVDRQAGRAQATADSLKMLNQDLARAQAKLYAAEDRASREMIVLFSLMGLCIVALIVVLIMVLRNRNAGRTTLASLDSKQRKLEEVQQRIADEQLRLDNKLLETIDVALQMRPGVPDHTLALRVADEIVRIEANLSRMDPAVKGYKQLKKAVERISDNFRANGYEIENMLGMPYSEGLKLTANFVDDSSLAEGQMIITKVLKPQIRYNGEVIQTAEVTVSQNN